MEMPLFSIAGEGDNLCGTGSPGGGPYATEVNVSSELGAAKLADIIAGSSKC